MWTGRHLAGIICCDQGKGQGKELAMAGKRKRRAGDRVIEGPMMTPMIDVVFQLLIYFIVTIKPIDISAHLDVFRPSAHSPPPESLVPPKMIQIKIFSGALLMNERSVDMQGLEGI